MPWVAQQVVGIRKAALEHATGFEIVPFLSALKNASMQASQLELMYPFELQLKVQGILCRFIQQSRIKGIKRFGTHGRVLHEEQKSLI